MPKISLIICTHGDRLPLTRLLEHTRGCYDELLVIHDGPDFEDVRSLVAQYGGRFIDRPRAFSQEPHVPFAYGEATHNWILRFDSDEYPSSELKDWIREFRNLHDVDARTAGYQWIWPAWNGRKRISMNWPFKFLRLFDRNKVTMVGLCEHGPEADAGYVSPTVPLRIWHEPSSPSHGLRNIFGKERTRQVRKNLARALLGSPLDHPRWRYERDTWPLGWQEVKDHPILTALWRLLVWPPRQAAAMLLAGDLPRPSVFCHAGLFHATVCFEYWRMKRVQARSY
jgi:hypothetical protein